MCCNIFLTFDFIPAALLPSCPSLGQPGHRQGRCPGCPSAARAAQVRPTAPSTPDVKAASRATLPMPRATHVRRVAATVLSPPPPRPPPQLLRRTCAPRRATHPSPLQRYCRAIAGLLPVALPMLQCLIYLCAKLIPESTPSLTILFHCLLLYFKIATIMQLSHCLITEALNFY